MTTTDPAALEPTSAEPHGEPARTEPAPAGPAPDGGAPAGPEPTESTQRPTRVSRKDLRAAEPKPVTGAQLAIGATLGRPRPRGHAARALALVVLAALVLIPLGIYALAGRPEPPGPAATTLPALAGDAAVSDALEVTGRLGSVPVLTLRGALTPPQTTVVDVIEVGDGHVLSPGDGVLLSVATFSGTDGTNTTGGEGRRCYRGSLDAEALGEDLAAALTGQAEGTRLVLRAPAGDGAGGTEVTVVDIMPTLADGEAVPPASQDDSGAVPTVTAAQDGTVSVSLDGLAAPVRGSATLLIKGDGEQIRQDDSVIARYQVVSWSTGEVRTSSYGWSQPPAVIRMSDTFAGLAQRLTDVHVGSRVVVSLPADEARGQDALAVVVDVLAIGDTGDADTQPEATQAPTDVVRVTPSAAPTSDG